MEEITTNGRLDQLKGTLDAAEMSENRLELCTALNNARFLIEVLRGQLSEAVS